MNLYQDQLKRLICSDDRIEVEVRHKTNIEAPLKRVEILRDLITTSGKSAVDPNMPIQAFQKNGNDTFTITLKTRQDRLVFENKLNNQQTLGSFNYKTSSADIIGGSLTVLGCPDEYPPYKIRSVMNQYVDIIRIKQGHLQRFSPSEKWSFTYPLQKNI